MAQGNNDIGVCKYKVVKPFTLFDRLFVDDDVIWIQSYDPVGGRWQKVFDFEKDYLGSISSDRFFDLKDGYIDQLK